MKTFKQYLEEIKIRNAAGKVVNLPNVKVRMASGKVESHPPGKSGSSGGGGNGD